MRVVVCSCGWIAAARMRLESDRRLTVVADTAGLIEPTVIAFDEPDVVVVDEPDDDAALRRFAALVRALAPSKAVVVFASSDAAARWSTLPGIDAALETPSRPRPLADRILALVS